jgi:hypothetical protein
MEEQKKEEEKREPGGRVIDGIGRLIKTAFTGNDDPLVGFHLLKYVFVE